MSTGVSRAPQLPLLAYPGCHHDDLEVLAHDLAAAERQVDALIEIGRRAARHA